MSGSDLADRRFAFLILAGALGLACATTSTEAVGRSTEPALVTDLASPLAPPLAPPPTPSSPAGTQIQPASRPGLATRDGGPLPASGGPAPLAYPGGGLAGPPCTALVGPRAIKRSALGRTIDAGLGSWLRGVDVDAKLERGRFQGWLIRAVHVGDPCWADTGLHPGDVVSRINRRSIERPEQAQAVWTSLRTAREIVVDLLREGQPQILRFEVVDGSD